LFVAIATAAFGAAPLNGAAKTFIGTPGVGSGLPIASSIAAFSAFDVDGFGSESKLSVGDATWFAGVNFEF